MAGPGLALELSDEEPEPEPEPRPRARAISRSAASGRAMPTSRSNAPTKTSRKVSAEAGRFITMCEK